MSAFEFAMIPVAIVIGFALTRLLNCWASITKGWSTFRKPGLFLTFTLFLMFGILSHFVGDWSFRDVEFGFGRLVLIIMPTLLMILSISIMVPEPTDLPDNLEKHYFGCIRKSLGLMVLAILLSLIPDRFPGVANPPPIWMVGLVIGPMIVLVLSTQKAVHIGGLIFMGLVMLLQVSGLSEFGQM
jgi:hypothetical protein